MELISKTAQEEWMMIEDGKDTNLLQELEEVGVREIHNIIDNLDKEHELNAHIKNDNKTIIVDQKKQRDHSEWI